jgi:hypothetical protein
MRQELIEQRQNALQYNQASNHLVASFSKPLQTYFDAEWFARVTFILNDKQECIGHHGLTTDLNFLMVESEINTFLTQTNF